MDAIADGYDFSVSIKTHLRRSHLFARLNKLCCPADSFRVSDLEVSTRRNVINVDDARLIVLEALKGRMTLLPQFFNAVALRLQVLTHFSGINCSGLVANTVNGCSSNVCGGGGLGYVGSLHRYVNLIVKRIVQANLIRVHSHLDHLRTIALGLTGALTRQENLVSILL